MNFLDIEKETYLLIGTIICCVFFLRFILKLADGSPKTFADYRRETRRNYHSGKFNFPRYYFPPLSPEEKQIIRELNAGQIPAEAKIILCFHCGYPNYELSHRCHNCGILLQRSVWDPVYKIFQYGSFYRQALKQYEWRQSPFRRFAIFSLIAYFLIYCTFSLAMIFFIEPVAVFLLIPIAFYLYLTIRLLKALRMIKSHHKQPDKPA